MLIYLTSFSALAVAPQVPGRSGVGSYSWEVFAWPSNRPLSSWFNDIILRANQLHEWSSKAEVPRVMWMPGLCNPAAFTAAVVQVCFLLFLL